MTNITVEKIDEIIKEIDTSKKLGQNEAQKLLIDINKSLIEVKKSAEKGQEEIVNKKVEELRGKIDENLSDEGWMWGTTKVLLDTDIKGGLEELKNEIIKLEKSQEVFAATPIAINEPKGNVIFGSKEVEELAKWRGLFFGLTPEQAKEKLEELEKAKAKPNIIDIEKQAFDIGNEITRLGIEQGTNAIGGLGGAIGGLGVGAVHLATGAANIGAFYVDKNIEQAQDLVKEGMGGLKDHIEKHAENAKELFGKGMDNAKDLIEKNLNVAEKAVEGGIGVKAGIFEAGIGVGRNVSKEVESEMLRKELEERKQELERNRINYEQGLKNERDRVARELEQKDNIIKELRTQIVEQSGKTQENFLSVIEMVTKSSSRPSSPTPPPAYDKQ